MFKALPDSTIEMMDWDWEQFKPYFDDLINRPLTTETLDRWMADYTKLGEILSEIYTRLYVRMVQDTIDETASKHLNIFLDTIFVEAQPLHHALQVKIADSGLPIADFELPLRRIKAGVTLFRTENIALLLQEEKLTQEYDTIVGEQTVAWGGEELTIAQMTTVLQSTERTKREEAWRLTLKRQLDDRNALNTLWVKFLEVRHQLAQNAGFDNFRDYQWQRLNRFDYTPQDCLRFHQAVADEVVPVAARHYEHRRELLGIDTLRPWDLDVDPLARHPLRPFENIQDFISGSSRIFNQVDPVLGRYFDDLHQNNLLDLDNRKNKAPGGFCTTFDVTQKPYIFMNAVGTHDDLQTLLHEGGHAFHAYESWRFPYAEQRDVPTEFAEVASMAMELLAMPYISKTAQGFYSDDDARRAQIEHLETTLYFWPFMSVVDSFQHWVYEHIEDAKDPAKCDQQWATLWQHYMQGIDWTGLEAEMMTGWHRKLHIFQEPFYYIEYGLAQLGAVQVWQKALNNQPQAVADYRKALQLGGVADLPTLYATAGAMFSFDSDVLGSAVNLIEAKLVELETHQV